MLRVLLVTPFLFALSAQAQDAKPFSKEQLDQLTAQVALYPDSLLAQLLISTSSRVSRDSPARVRRSPAHRSRHCRVARAPIRPLPRAVRVRRSPWQARWEPTSSRRWRSPGSSAPASTSHGSGASRRRPASRSFTWTRRARTRSPWFRARTRTRQPRRSPTRRSVPDHARHAARSAARRRGRGRGPREEMRRARGAERRTRASAAGALLAARLSDRQRARSGHAGQRARRARDKFPRGLRDGDPPPFRVLRHRDPRSRRRARARRGPAAARRGTGGGRRGHDRCRRCIHRRAGGRDRSRGRLAARARRGRCRRIARLPAARCAIRASGGRCDQRARALDQLALSHAFEQADSRSRGGIEGFDRAGHRDAHLSRRLRGKCSGEPRAFVADGNGDAPREERVVQVVLPAATVAITSPPASRSPPPMQADRRPRKDRRRSAHPAPRATPSATMQTRSASRAAPARRLPQPPCAQHRADIAGILHVVQQQAEFARGPRGCRRRRDHGQQAHPRGQRRELAESCRNDERPARMLLRQRADPGPRQRFFGDDQGLGGAAPGRVDGHQVLALEHALSRLAAVARGGNEARRLAQARVVPGGDALHGGKSLPSRVGGGKRWRRSALVGRTGRRPDRQGLVGGAGAVVAPCSVGGCTWKKTSSCFTIPSSERARSSIASRPLFRSRTSASRASLRDLSRAFASICAAS